MKWRAKTNLLVRKLNGRRFAHSGGQLLEHPFGELHEFLIVGIGLIELKHGKFRVVLGTHSFITKISVDFINSFKPADNQTFQEKFRSDSEIHIERQSVVMGNKRSRDCASGYRMHHGCFYFKKPVFIHKFTNALDNTRAYLKCFLNVLVYDQIQVALSIAKFLIRQSMKFFWKWLKRFCKDTKIFNCNAQFASSSSK